jgi:hypothetical protein
MAVLTAAGLATSGLAADTPIAFKDLPEVVQKTMLQETKATGAKIKNTLIEMEDGKKFFECESILANGRTRDFLVDQQGNVSEVEDEMEMDEVPVAIRSAVQRAAGQGGKIKKLEAVKHDGKVIGYEASIVSKDGKKKGMEMNMDGTLKK